MALVLELKGSPGATLTFTRYAKGPLNLEVFTDENERADCEFTKGQLIELQNYLNKEITEW